MPKCIFCKSRKGVFKTREHILPESLGGGDWAILPDGLVCDHCQNHFGSSIEQQALADYPFSLLRVLLGIPTKKKKAPWLKSWEGKVMASIRPGEFVYEPARPFRQAMEEGSKSQIRLLAYPLKPHMVCRFLLKMAIEVVAAHDSEAVFNEKFDEARDFALCGEKEKVWWYLQRQDVSTISGYITRGLTLEEWKANVKLEVLITEDGARMFRFKFLGMDLFTPMESGVEPPPRDSLAEPEFLLFFV